MDVRIGITTSFQEEEQRLHRAYVLAVERAGGLPLIVPMVEGETTARAFAEGLDGLVITGGPAVTDGLVGTLPDDIDETEAVRSESDRRILRAFLDARKPILGICYGMQLLNAEAGGTLYADVQHQVEGTLVHSSTRGGETHPLRIVPGTLLGELLGPSEFAVNTRHIQAVADVAGPYRVSATAPDGVVEAFEDADGLIVGVQFHPERMGAAMEPLFRHLVDRARAARRSAGVSSDAYAIHT